MRIEHSDTMLAVYANESDERPTVIRQRERYVYEAHTPDAGRVAVASLTTPERVSAFVGVVADAARMPGPAERAALRAAVVRLRDAGIDARRRNR